MNYEKNRKIIDRLTASIVVIVFLAIFVMPNIYAISDNNIDFSNQPLIVNDTMSVFNGNNNYWTVTNNITVPVYICAIKADDNNGVYYCFAQNIHENEIQNLYIQIQDGRQYPFNSQIREIIYNNQTWYISHTNIMYEDSSVPYLTVPYYSNKDINLETVIADIISTGGGGTGGGSVSSTLNYNLPAGNVAYIEIGDGVPNISMMSSVMPVKSAAFSSDTGWNSTQRVGFAESLPSNGENLASFGTKIEWIKDGNTNIFGQTQNAKFTAPSLSGHKYLVVVNPLYYAIQYTNGEGIATTESGVNSTVNNNAVNIFMNYSKGITVFQLTQNVTINNNIPTYSNDVSSGPYEGDIDPDTGDVTWTDPEGGSSQPTTGGGNVPGTGENNFNSFLSGVANRIVNVFQPAHDAILTLSNAVQNIAGWMYALYVWLPAPVLSILTSAISLAIIIGLIKVFV